MSFGTFTLVIDGEQLDGTAETKAKLHLEAQGPGTLRDDAGDQFKFPTKFAKAGGESISLPYTLTLFTDSTSGNSTTIGYEGYVSTDNSGRVSFQFAAPEAGSTVQLVDLTDDVVTPISDLQTFRDEAEAARDEAVSAAASVPTEAELSATYVTLNEGDFNALHGTTTVDRTGATDASAGLQAALDAVATVQRTTQESVYNAATTFAVRPTLYIPGGEYKINTALVWPAGINVILAPDAKIKAGAAMGAMIATNPATLHQRVTFQGGILDCNNLAAGGLDIGYFAHINLIDVQIHHQTGHGIILGDTTAPGSSYEGLLQNIDIWRPRNASIPAAKYGIWMRNCTDSRVQIFHIAGVETGVRNDGANNRFITGHVWNYGDSPTGLACAFDDNGLGFATYTDCYSDGGAIGWRIRTSHVTIMGGLAGTVTSATSGNADNTAIAVQCDQSNATFLIVGLRVIGADASHRFARDLLVPSNTDNAAWVGLTSSNVVTQVGGNRDRMRGLHIRNPATTSTGSVFQRPTSGSTGPLTAWWDETSTALAEVTAKGEMRSSGILTNAVTKTSGSYTVGQTDGVVFSNGAAGITLPDAASAVVRVAAGGGNFASRRYTIRNIHASSLVTIGAVAGTVDGAATINLAAGAKATFITDGTNWWSI